MMFVRRLSDLVGQQPQRVTTSRRRASPTTSGSPPQTVVATAPDLPSCVLQSTVPSSAAPYLRPAGLEVPQHQPWRLIMKIIASALVALSFVAGVVAPASAAEPFSIKQLDMEGRGGHAG